MSEKKSSLEPEEEHENHERWLITYADMITLLTAFFIMLYSMSVVNIAKFQKLALSVRAGFNGPVKASGGMSIVEKGQVSTLDRPKYAEQLDEPAKALAPLVRTHPGDNSPEAGSLGDGLEAVKALRSALGPQADIKVKPSPGGFSVELVGEDIFFGAGSIELSEAARKALVGLAPSLARFRWVSVEGHTGEGGGFMLSSSRALAVAQALHDEGGLDDSKLSVTGFSAKAPMKAAGKDTVRILVRR